MKQLFAFRRPSTWSNVLMVVISITFMIVWLPFIRSLFDGDTYQWGMDYFGLFISGAGITPSFIFLVIQLALYTLLIIGMYRMANRSLYHVLLGLWWINVFGNLISDIIINGDTQFHGETMNVHISIAMIVIPLSLLALLLVLVFIRSESQYKLSEPLPWSLRNQKLGIAFLLSLPVVFILLFFGEPHATTDEMGVIIAISHCFYIPFVFKPYVKALNASMAS